MRLRPLVALAAAVAVAACADAPTGPGGNPPPLTVPAIEREFRGMWIATVANIDWPSTPGLSIGAQQQQFTDLLDVAAETGLNAVILQVRAAGDALYESSLEPWSRSLMGTQGTAPGYDPLIFAVAEAHARGLELHAWFNPFRAGNLADTLTLAANHFARVRPDVTRRYCTQLWFDPAEAAVQDHAIAVVRDVVNRYGVDAVHIDDFFYPYPSSSCPGLDFPDSAGYAAFLAGGGTLSRAEWRRANVNRFVERLYSEVRALSPSVRVGVSPFGIWRPGNPAGITGLDAYAAIYADSRRWLQEGWVDYFAPQLYWSIASTGQSFPALLGWWREQNVLGRHLWPGLASYRVADGTGSAFSSAEIPNQVGIIRQQAALARGPTGAILYNASSVRSDRGGFATALQGGAFRTRALPPPTTWLDATGPGVPAITVSRTATSFQVNVSGDADAYWWLIRWRVAGEWSQQLIPAGRRVLTVTAGAVEGVAVAAIDRVGNASAHATWTP